MQSKDKTKVGDVDMSKIGDKAGIHWDDQARHLERGQEKEFEIIEGNETGSWQIKEKDEESASDQ